MSLIRMSISLPGRLGGQEGLRLSCLPLVRTWCPLVSRVKKDQVLDPCRPQQGWALCLAGSHTSTHNNPRRAGDFH